jgi:hypothetical protein
LLNLIAKAVREGKTVEIPFLGTLRTVNYEYRVWRSKNPLVVGNKVKASKIVFKSSDSCIRDRKKRRRDDQIRSVSSDDPTWLP